MEWLRHMLSVYLRCEFVSSCRVLRKSPSVSRLRKNMRILENVGTG